MQAHQPQSRHSAAYAAAVAAEQPERIRLAKIFAYIGVGVTVLALLTQSSFRDFLGRIAYIVAWFAIQGYEALEALLGSTVRALVAIVSAKPVALASFTLLLVVLAAVYCMAKNSLAARMASGFATAEKLPVEDVLAERAWMVRFYRAVLAVKAAFAVLLLLNVAVIWPVDITVDNFFFEQAYVFSYVAVFACVCFLGLGCYATRDFSMPYLVLLHALKARAGLKPLFKSRMVPLRQWRTSPEGVEFFKALVAAGLDIRKEADIAQALAIAGSFCAEHGSEDYFELKSLVVQMVEFGISAATPEESIPTLTKYDVQ